MLVGVRNGLGFRNQLRTLLILSHGGKVFVPEWDSCPSAYKRWFCPLEEGLQETRYLWAAAHTRYARPLPDITTPKL